MCKGGHLSIKDLNIFIEACKSGDLKRVQDVLVDIHQLLHHNDKVRAIVQAAQNGQSHVIQFLHEQGFDWFNAYDVAATHGQLECLQALVSVGCPITGTAIAYAARDGHLHVVKWILTLHPYATGDPKARPVYISEAYTARTIDHNCLIHPGAALEAGLIGREDIVQTLVDTNLVSWYKWDTVTPRLWIKKLVKDIFARAVILSDRDTAATRIQTAWRCCVANPSFQVCRERLVREFHCDLSK